MSTTGRPGARDRLIGLRSFYSIDEEIDCALPAGATGVRAVHASGRSVEGRVVDGRAHVGPLTDGTYVVQAIAEGAGVIGEDIATIARHPGERPVHGFATSFEQEAIPETLEWLRELRVTVVQIYDWMHQYAAPLGPGRDWVDPSGRPVSLEALRQLSSGIRAMGGVPHAYAPIYALDLAFAASHPDWLLYRNDGVAQGFLNTILLADPAQVGWQRHFAETYGRAADSIGFTGFHVDTYGYPRAAQDHRQRPIEIRDSYEGFLGALRERRPRDMISFNQVNGVPAAVALPPGPGFRYCEVWPPNGLWRHLEGLLDRSRGSTGCHGRVSDGRAVVRGTLACYPPVWQVDGLHEGRPGGQRMDGLRTVMITEAVATMLGASTLLYGDLHGALCDPYYPNYARLRPEEVVIASEWHRFALRHRDLFIDGEDTSWSDVGDENGAVAAMAAGPVLPEPVGGAVFLRVVRSSRCVAIGALDLTGSASGSWAEPTARASATQVTVDVVLPGGADWRAAAASVGEHHGRFSELATQAVPTKQGTAWRIRLPLSGGWAVARFSR